MRWFSLPRVFARCLAAPGAALLAVVLSVAGGPARSAPASAPACIAGRPVVFAGLDWDSGAFLTALERAILERGYACPTSVVPGTTVTLEQAVAVGDAQVIAEEWVGRSPIWNAAMASGKVTALGRIVTGAEEGLYVPDELVHGPAARAAGLARVQQLAEPRMVALFRDPEQPAQGRFLNCPSGWTCERVNTAKLKAYGLANSYVDFRPGSGAAMDADITAALLQHRPTLFYYYSPSTLAGRFKLFRLAEPPYSAACWADIANPDGRHDTGCTSPPAVIASGVNVRFLAAAPGLGALLRAISLPAPALNAELADAAANRRGADAQAVLFLKHHSELWRGWVPPPVADRIAQSLAREGGEAEASGSFPARWVMSIRAPVNRWVAGVVAGWGGGFRALAARVTSLTALIDAGLRWVPWWLLIGLCAGLTGWRSRSVGPAAVVAGALLTIGVLGLWDAMLQTVTLMLISVGLAVIIGLPCGVWAAKSRLGRAVTPPVLDFLQTMPAFVYLIPALMLLGLGKAPAILAMVIYATPPLIRLTELGIRNSDPEVREAATAFGATPLQTLIHVELPLARPSILAGLNQTILMALAMVVTASMIGARGLGEDVLNGIQSLDVGKGFEAGLGIVVLALALDRMAQALAGEGRRKGGAGGHG
jgi:ABC-type proline/glycine betaine transport system permease subunit/ABC-type proline/glycine betaine transport system substrate-binding protein